MKPEKYREMSEEELVNEIHDLQEELFNLKMSKSVGQLDNPKRIKIVRHDVARAKTILNEHLLNIQKLRPEV